MAFDYGSIDLGLRNPFKLTGAVTALRGLLQTLIGGYLLLNAAASVKSDAASGWILMLFGLYLLSAGLVVMGQGIYASLRYFVGRNHPTSLALNFSRSESSNSATEADYVAYTDKQLEEMLFGRKNVTFKEPIGFLARLLHSLFPNLLYMPYPIRNVSQRLFGAWIKTLVAVVAYGFVAFVSLTGFAGDLGPLVFPLYSVLLTLYLLLVWHGAGRSIARQAERDVEALGITSIVKVISIALIMPALLGLGLSHLLSTTGVNETELSQWLGTLPAFHANWYLMAILIGALLTTALSMFLLYKRLRYVDSSTEVSELRENWQESVHPNEIFINLDNLVMANRRYREVPNRVYRELDPKLNEQVQGKGDFHGEMIQEIQPKVRPMQLGSAFRWGRIVALISGNLLYAVGIVLSLLLAFRTVDFYQFIQQLNLVSGADWVAPDNLQQLGQEAMLLVQLILSIVLLRSFARILSLAAHLMFAEIQFGSLLIYFKCEGTFTESRISTGSSIYDSTRSENHLVRSSITPWIIVTRVVSSTFAATGINNLEHPRHILEMHKDDDQLQAIRTDVISFLKDRESIASITSKRDLVNASQIHQLNKQTRAQLPQDVSPARLRQDAEAAGHLHEHPYANDEN